MVNTGFTFKVRQPVIGNAGPDGFAADIYQHGRVVLTGPTLPDFMKATEWGLRWCQDHTQKQAS